MKCRGIIILMQVLLRVQHLKLNALFGLIQRNKMFNAIPTNKSRVITASSVVSRYGTLKRGKAADMVVLFIRLALCAIFFGFNSFVCEVVGLTVYVYFNAVHSTKLKNIFLNVW